MILYGQNAFEFSLITCFNLIFSRSNASFVRKISYLMTDRRAAEDYYRLWPIEDFWKDATYLKHLTNLQSFEFRVGSTLFRKSEDTPDMQHMLENILRDLTGTPIASWKNLNIIVLETANRLYEMCGDFSLPCFNAYWIDLVGCAQYSSVQRKATQRWRLAAARLLRAPLPGYS